MSNMGDKYTHRVTLRLNDNQFKFLTDVSEMLGVSPSDYVRMTINSGMVSAGDIIAKMKSGDASLNDICKGEVGTNENVKTDSDNKL